MRDPSPIRRLSALIGLIALLPLALLLIDGQLTLLETGLRALAVLVAVVVVRRLADWVVRGVATSLERHARSTTE